MGTSELWTSDNSLYKFTESTSMNPSDGEIIREQEDLRQRMIHIRHTTNSSLYNKMNNDSESPQLHKQKINYATMRPKAIDTERPEDYSKQLYLAFLISSLCNNSAIQKDEETGDYKSIGDPTEIALTVAAQKGSLDREYWTNLGFKKVFERAFDSERKLMSSVYHAADGNHVIGNENMIMTCKGAPEELLRKCSHYMKKDVVSVDDASLEMTDDFASQVNDENVRMASQGLRVLGLAYKIIPVDSIESLNEEVNVDEDKGLSSPSASSSSDNKDPSLNESDFVFVGLVGLIDPPKQGVKEAVETCQQAGIHVIMITGDHVETATAIARQLGIFKGGVPGMSRAILGRELDLLSDDAIIELDPFPSVFARVSPDNKLSIVRALQQRGELVAMTGDGVNDAPAIKRADVGVAMGQAGTEITKQAADIVLVDDNFTSIVDAVEEGRHVFDNILKFIVYLLSCNGAEIFLMLICTIANIDAPLTVMMILWANIIGKNYKDAIT
jgi:Ca2+-transporting ATPase